MGAFETEGEEMIDYDKLFEKYEFRKFECFKILPLGSGNIRLDCFYAIDEFKLTIETYSLGEMRYDLQFNNNDEIEIFINAFKKYDL